GTPNFAVPALQALEQDHQVVGVVTQPDRPAGRGRRLVAPPVKEAAQALGLDVFQPATLRRPEAVERLVAWQPDLVVVAAFGQILRPEVLAIPPHGCLNVHASLLPRYRGAAPIPAAILAGDERTGVTIMRMDEGLDTGPMLAQADWPIGSRDTTGSLTEVLARLGAGLLVEVLPGWLAGAIAPRPQDEAQATYCRTLRKEDGLLDWALPAAHLDRQVRACDPWPGAYTTWAGQRLKILRARPLPGRPGARRAEPGRVVDLAPGMGVAAGEGVLELLEVQLAGKSALDVQAFGQGRRDFVGSPLGGEG
ncbi:MAG: methionyl-tRNA formyltransferase, partial [Chloroflexi bacterium]